MRYRNKPEPNVKIKTVEHALKVRQLDDGCGRFERPTDQLTQDAQCEWRVLRNVTRKLHKHGRQEGLETDGRAAQGEARCDSEVHVLDDACQLAHHAQVAQEVLVVVYDTQLREDVLRTRNSASPSHKHTYNFHVIMLTNKFPSVAFGSK